MEFVAWSAHKYVMHGFLWYLHEDHHILTGKIFQKNDAFALIFAIPSVSCFFIGRFYEPSWLIFVGTGIKLSYQVPGSGDPVKRLFKLYKFPGP